MLGKTHMMVGIASTLAVTRPQTISEIVMASSIGAVGALISDIDVGTSHSHKDASRIVLLTAMAVAVTLALDFFAHLGIINKIMADSNYARISIGILMFTAICAFGKEQPHRSFMHSFLALAGLNFAIGLIYVPIAKYFAVGFLSHLATDIFNKKKVRLLYPLKNGFSLNLFHAHGTANTVLFFAGSVISAIEVIILIIMPYIVK